MPAPDLDYLLNVCTLSPLLTAEQEIMYGKRIQAGIALTNPASEQYVAKPNAKQKRVIQSGLRAEKAMVNANLRLVINCAKKYVAFCHLQHLDFSDLVQEGVIGLVRGAQKYDPTRGYKFSTYAYWWIRQGVTRAIQVQDRSIRLPMYCGDLFKRLQAYRMEFLAKHGRKPTTKEEALFCGCPELALRHYLKHLHGVSSLDQPVKALDKAHSTLGELVTDESTPAYEQIEAELDNEILFRALHQLNAKEKAIVEHRFELFGAKLLTRMQISAKLGISRERVRQLEERAIIRLKNLMRHEPLNFRNMVGGLAETYVEQLEFEVAA